MGRRPGSVNQVDIANLPRGVSFLKDGRARPFIVRHRDLKKEAFATPELAVARKNELIELEKSHGSAALTYSREVHADVTAARLVLPIGVSHLQAAEFWLTHHASVIVSLDMAIKQFIELRRSQSIRPDGWTRHVKDLKGRLRRFELAFEGRELAEITGESILLWLSLLTDDDSGGRLAARSVANYRIALENFFNFAVRRKFVPASPMGGAIAEDLPTVRRSKKHPLTIDQANGLMSAIEELSPVDGLHFALRLFVGIRTEESQRFQLDWIQRDQVRILIPGWFFRETGDAEGRDLRIEQGSKTGDDWAIDDVSPRFWRIYDAWILGIGAGRTGTVPRPTNNRWHGYAKPQGNRKPIPSLKKAVMKRLELASWPHNACRDTFCTLHMSAYRSAERTALVLKHRNSQTLWQSYLGTLVPQAEAVVFFEG
jgi:hypothetical protein